MSYEPWHPTDRDILELMWWNGSTAKRIAARLFRTPRAIHAQVHLRQLKRRYAPASRIERRLTWQHGDTRAASILAGNDPTSNADLASWNRLGSGRERAA